MLPYIERQTKQVFKNDYETEIISLEYDYNLKEIIIDNLPNLKRITIIINEDLYVSVSNCNRLEIIECFSERGNCLLGSYFYIGENLNSLKSISMGYFKTIKMTDEILNNLSFLRIKNVNELLCDFKNFKNLNAIDFKNVMTPNMIVDSNIVRNVKLSNCSFHDIEIIGGGYIYKFKFINNTYNLIHTNLPFTFSFLYLYNYDNEDSKVISYIPLDVDTVNVEDLDTEEIPGIYFSVNSIYDYEYKNFIEDNQSLIDVYNKDILYQVDYLGNIIEDHDDYILTLDDINFTDIRK